MEVVRLLVEAFKNNVTLHHEYVARIAVAARTHLMNKCGTLNRITVPKTGKIVVVGDTHGQFTDLVSIFEAYGLPSEDTIYLINGDLVDRGPQGLENVMTVFSLLLARPGTVCVNRGNHEQRHMNEKYHFQQQLLARYGEQQGMVLFDLLQKTFKEFPLATVINDKIFVTHGGLCEYDDVTLDELAKLPRVNLKAMEPEGKEALRRYNIIKGLLWSDPTDQIEGVAVSRRGSGVNWGASFTQRFLDRNKLQLIIRSHQVKEEGFEWQHGNRVLTLFSASNYCGTMENKAAVALFTGTQLHAQGNIKPEIHSFYAQAFSGEESQGIASECEKSSIQKIRERIFLGRHPLMASFSAKDRSNTGTVSLEDFIAVMKMHIPLQWELLWRYFAVPQAVGTTSAVTINYADFLARHKPKLAGSLFKKWVDETNRGITKYVHQNSNNIETAFEHADTDGNKKLSMVEFSAVLSQVGCGLPDAQLSDLFRAIDVNKDGQIDYQEFFNFFEPTAKEEEEWVTKQRKRVLRFVCLKHTSMSCAFRSWPGFTTAEGDGQKPVGIMPEQVQQFLKSVGLSYTTEECLRLSQGCTTAAADKTILIDLTALKFQLRRIEMQQYEKKSRIQFYDSVRYAIAQLFHEQRLQLQRVFRMMDTEHTGFLSVTGLECGLRALNVLVEVPLTHKQLKRLHQALDTNQDGHVSYEELVAGLTFGEEFQFDDNSLPHFM
eukprot:TRINITY_DN4929_c0_g1_i1.p1 TRINITY_DN4929_c0_g1~~TRINITY_DN4929_c0_g1_i1.p1  ORF type:complete len:815 (+),score=180.69 TRINITY_DN4929_c0_g1_i1:295-2445(+)